MAKKTESRNVLVTRFSALGDVAMTLPVIYDACAANPGMRFVVLTKPLPAKMFLHTPPNLTVVPVDTARYPGVMGMRRLLDEMIAGHDIDTIVDLHNVLRTKMLRFWGQMRGLRTAAVDKGRRARRALTRRRNKEMVPLTPMAQRYRDVFDALHINVTDSFSSLFPSHRGKPERFAAVTPPKQPGEHWIAIAPFAAHRGKVYDLAHMLKVVDALSARPDTRIFIFGAGNDEAILIDTMAKGHPNVVSMAAAKIGLQAEIALMSHCDVMLAMDSANMHLAALAGIPVVSIWGATHPYTGFYGFRQDPANAVQLDMVCRPCSIFGNKPCARGDWFCLNGIPPQTVVNRVEALLKPATISQSDET